VYGAPHDEGEDKFLAELATFCSMIRVPYIVGGDFNIVRFPSDKNRNFHPNRYTDTLNAVIHVNELRELDISGGRFTWSNNQVNLTLEKLDMLMSRDWELIFLVAHLYKVPRECSDHNPLFLTTSYNTSTSFREFSFELSWLKHPDFKPRVGEVWAQPTRDEMTMDRINSN
jgi:hypothetical protein